MDILSGLLDAYKTLPHDVAVQSARPDPVYRLD